MKISFIFVLSLFSFSYSQIPIYIYDMPPLHRCDPGTQLSFDQFAHSQYQNILSISTILTMANLTFDVDYTIHCFLGFFPGEEDFTPDDEFVVFGEWTSLVFNYGNIATQPIAHEALQIITYHPDRPWFWFRGLTYKTFIVFLLIPIFFGIYNMITENKLRVYYYVLHYLGGVFYLPDIIHQLSPSQKVINIFSQLISLIVVTLFLATLQYSMNDVKTLGGFNPSDRLFNKKVMVEKDFLTIGLNQQFIPFELDNWYIGGFLEYYLATTVDKTYLMPQTLVKEALSKDCRWKIVADEYLDMELSFELSPAVPNDFRRKLNIAITDFFEYRSILGADYVNWADVIPEYKCDIGREYFDLFQYKPKDLGSLYIFLFVGIVLALLWIVYFTFKEWRKNIKKEFHFEGIRDISDKHITNNLKILFLISCQIRAISFHFLIYPLITRKLKSYIRQINEKSLLKKKLMQIRLRLVLKVAREKFLSIKLKMIRFLLDFSRNRKNDKTNFVILKQRLAFKNQSIKKFSVEPVLMRSFFFETTKYIFSLVLKMNNISNYKYNPQLKIAIRGNGLSRKKSIELSTEFKQKINLSFDIYQACCIDSVVQVNQVLTRCMSKKMQKSLTVYRLSTRCMNRMYSKVPIQMLAKKVFCKLEKLKTAALMIPKKKKNLRTAFVQQQNQYPCFDLSNQQQLLIYSQQKIQYNLLPAILIHFIFSFRLIQQKNYKNQSSYNDNLSCSS